MTYSELEAKELVIKAGKMLVENGLIARTWGNISARISDTEFVITPSGLAYETLTPDKIVTLKIKNCSYQGNIKPSSEKGIHADAYLLRPDVNFVIHTHQVKATVISLEGKNIEVDNRDFSHVLGDIVPCADYGISSTKKLRKAVALSIKNNKDSNAVLMKHHGALCMGTDLENAFLVAENLEKLATKKYESLCGTLNEIDIPDYGSSTRKGETFEMILDGVKTVYDMNKMSEDTHKAAIFHWDIYRKNKVNAIVHANDKYTVEFSKKGTVLNPYLDDLAQIAGINILNEDFTNFENPYDTEGPRRRKSAIDKLKGKNVVFLKNEGAICTGLSNSDAEAVKMVLTKGCQADLYASTLNDIECLGNLDAKLQRFIYVKKYSKIKK